MPTSNPAKRTCTFNNTPPASAEVHRHRLIKGSVWVFVSRISGILMLLASNMVMARTLSPEEFGLFALAVAAVTIITIVARLGLDQTIIRFLSEDFAHGNVSKAVITLRACFALGILGTIVTCTVWGFLLAAFGSRIGLPTNPGMIVTWIFGIAAINLLSLTSESFRGIHDLQNASLFSPLSGPLVGLTFLIFVATLASTNTMSFQNAFIAYVASFAFVTPSAAVLFKKRFLIYADDYRRTTLQSQGQDASVPSKRLLYRQLMAVSFPIMLTQLLLYGLKTGDLAIAGVYCATDEIALFASACRVVTLVTLPLTMASMTIISSISELHSQKRIPELQRLLQKSATVSSIPSILLLMGIVLFPSSIMTLLFGPFYQSASGIVRILAIGQIACSLTGSCGYVLTMTGHHYMQLALNIGNALLLLLLGSLAAVYYGVFGLATASASLFAIRQFATLILARKLVGVWASPSFDAALWHSAAARKPVPSIADSSNN
jgi:O-antigen/teichoic acid export membrane protein